MKRKKEVSLKKYDMSFGDFVQSGFERPKFDFRKYPWPVKDDSVEEIYSAYMLCRIPGLERPKFIDEWYRVLVTGGKVSVIVPYWTSPRAIQDYTHEWPPLVEQSFLVFNKGWRDANGGKEYDVKSDFDFSYGYALEQETSGKNQDTQAFYVKHYTNSVNDLHVTLTKRA